MLVSRPLPGDLRITRILQKREWDSRYFLSFAILPLNVCMYGCINIWKPKDASTLLVNWGLLLLGGHAAPRTCLYLSPLPGYLKHMPQHMSFI